MEEKNEIQEAAELIQKMKQPEPITVIKEDVPPQPVEGPKLGED